MKPKALYPRVFFPAAVACTLSAIPLSAAPITWTGATSTDYLDAANWSPAVVPADDLTSDIATFSGAATANQPVLSANRSVNGIAFTSGGWTLAGTTTLNIGTAGITSSGNNTITETLNTTQQRTTASPPHRERLCA